MANPPVSAYVHLNQLVDAAGIQEEGVNKVANLVWDSVGLAWVKETQPGGGGGGGAVTIADGADAAQGYTTDSAVYGDVTGTLSAKLRGLSAWTIGTPGTANAPATYSVTNTDGVALAANASRKKLVIINVGNVWVFLGDGQTAVVNSGLALSPSGGTLVMDRNTFTTNAIHAICASSSTLSIQEYQ